MSTPLDGGKVDVRKKSDTISVTRHLKKDLTALENLNLLLVFKHPVLDQKFLSTRKKFSFCESSDSYKIIMSEIKSELDEMEQTNYSINSTNMDPKNNEELIIYVRIFNLFTLSRFINIPRNSHIQVQNLLQNVQDKFQCMSEQIISRIDDMGNR